MEHHTMMTRKERAAIILPSNNQNQSSNSCPPQLKKQVQWADQHWKEKMKAKRLILKLEDKSSCTRQRLEHQQEEAMLASFRLQNLQQELKQIENKQKDKQAPCCQEETYEQVGAGSTIENVSPEYIGKLSEALGEANLANHSSDSFLGPSFSPSGLKNISDSASPCHSLTRVEHISDSSSPCRSPTRVEQANVASTAKEGQEGRPTSLKALARWAYKTFSPTGVVDTGATWHFMQKGVGIPNGIPSIEVVGMPNGQTERATKQVLLHIGGMSEEARLGDELPSLQHNNLMIVSKFVDYGYTLYYYIQAKP